jgi:hypothetical protein
MKSSDLSEDEFHQRFEPELMEFMAVKDNTTPEQITAGGKAYADTLYQALHTPATETEKWLVCLVLSLLTTLREAKLKREAAPLMEFLSRPLSDA